MHATVPFAEAAEAHGEVFGEIRPACTFVEVSRFIDPAWLVEIEADCGKGKCAHPPRGGG